ncbi:hypothetical protein ASG17_08185 [Brevundimonas sp. Leaf363]|uniref:CC0125/CC1285 family lipoprotein n=1 Tax=Brevundimonas sp. Leaf363 TaxID=1736353 RepID=UPI0006F64A9E|nr:hypothetical protein [Brevundimonas sp. Leaf363]KQS56009.1 hypothetical protein ASG17_08185 [Brevundimonas sp. Leaf363]
MRRLTLTLVAASAALLAACQTMAPYGAQAGPRGQGYSEQRIESNRYRVSYNGVGDPMVSADYALLRAADLALQDGYDWFEVTGRWTDGRPDSRGGLRPRLSIGGGSTSWGSYRASGVGVGLGLDISGPQPTSTTLEVVMGRGATPSNPDAYNAREVQQALRGVN